MKKAVRFRDLEMCLKMSAFEELDGTGMGTFSLFLDSEKVENFFEF